MILSIVVLTMNRSMQLIEALESCLLCELPKPFEIIIINNGSTDDTEERINEFIKGNNDLNVKYLYSKTNLGVGGGRNWGFSEAQGEYVYFLDDDAVIDYAYNPYFFTEAISYLNKHKDVASLTTRIKDEMLKMDREVDFSKKKKDELYCVFKFLGGSHFLRKEAFSEPLYYCIKYGSEEYAPSIKAISNGYVHVFNSNISIIHKPKINKWVAGTTQMKDILVRGLATIYATKKILYPKIYGIVLYAGYKRRCQKYLSVYEGAFQEADEMVKQICSDNHDTKIPFLSVIKMFIFYGPTVF